MRESRKASLSPSAKKLVEMIQALTFGRIERLVITNGSPVFDPPPRVVREIKLAGENRSPREPQIADFALKGQVVEMFRQFERLRDGIVECIEVQNGLPFRLIIEEPNKQ